MTKTHLAFRILTLTLIGLWADGLVISPTQAQSECPHFGASPNVTLRIKPWKIILTNELSLSQITTLSGRRPLSSGVQSHWQPIGLTLTEHQFSMQIKVRAKQIAGNRFWGQLSGVEAQLGYNNLQVYIALK